MNMLTNAHSGNRICGSDGICVGTVDQVDGNRIRLIRDDSGNGDYQHISGDSVDAVENGIVWLRAKAAEVVSFGESDTTYEQ